MAKVVIVKFFSHLSAISAARPVINPIGAALAKLEFRNWSVPPRSGFICRNVIAGDDQTGTVIRDHDCAPQPIARPLVKADVSGSRRPGV